ncbi:non-homologous end-joining DNA ligase [Georgenia sp. Z1344]|uniref:non-homologous end-joining DNA ligase n=1 Tax=Georgenia sp. Z1344 TaxID=3416706 RepID=UPI003CE8FC4E
MADPDRDTVEIDGRRVRLTHPEKVMYPSTGTTKRDVVDYVVAVAPLVVRHGAGRPATRKRWPDGVGTAQDPGQSFFAKDLPGSVPHWVPRREQQHADHVNTYPLPDDAATLAWFVQMGTLEIHVPQWRFGPAARQELPPDRLVLDLDPGEGAGLAECVEVARLLRPRLDDLGLTSVPVTSGSTGVHVYAGLDGSATSDEVAEAAARLAREMAEEHPDLVVSTIRRDVRRGKVLIDWSQNRAARTTVTPYSMRGRTRPTVAVPRSWDELEDADLRQLTIDEVLERVRDVGDPMDVIAPLEGRAGTRHGAAMPVEEDGDAGTTEDGTGTGTTGDGTGTGRYEDRTVAELRRRARDLGLRGYSDLRKAELVDLLRNH